MADDLVTSALLRLAALGGLAGRVGVSMVASRLGDIGRTKDARAARRAALLVEHATRAAETLGRMKGAAMKVGQMLSLHGDLMPPEVSAVLHSLQRDAPKVPSEVMQEEARSALPRFDELFERLDDEPLAAASIGQVHRGLLRDGREVAVKIQYPLIRQMIEADLRNMKVVLHGLFALLSEVEFEPIWSEVQERLFEELDYEREARTMERAAALGLANVVVPGVVREASSARLLTMEYVPGIAPEDAASDRFPQELRDRWGAALFEWVLRGLFAHRWLHADPNFSNFAFKDDGRLVVYDFGCIKELPEAFARGYARLALAVTAGHKDALPAILQEMGVHRENGAPVSLALTGPYADLFAEIVREDPPYAFGENREMYQRLWGLGVSNFGEATDMLFPRDVVFVNRTLLGHYGNLARLHARGPWRAMVVRFAGAAAAGPEAPEDRS